MNGRVRGTIPTEQTVSLRRALGAKLTCHGRKGSIPHADKLDLNIHRESLLERIALLPPSFVIATEHLIREGNLLVVPRGDQAHLEPIGLDSILTFYVTGANLMNHAS